MSNSNLKQPPTVCSPLYCHSENKLRVAALNDTSNTDSDSACPLGNANAAEVWSGLWKGVANIAQLGFLVKDPDPSPDGDPIQKARDHLNEINALGSLIADKEIEQDLTDMITLIQSNQTLDMELMNLNSKYLNMGIEQNKLSIMISNVLLIMVIAYILFTN